MNDFWIVMMSVGMLINAALLIVVNVVERRAEKEKELFKEHEKIKEAWKKVD